MSTLSRLLEPLALAIYRVILNVLVPVAALPLLPFLLLSRRRRKTLFRRLGWQAYPQAQSAPGQGPRPVWIHALSVGEMLSAVNLIKEAHARLGEHPLYLSVSTFSAFELAQTRLGGHIDGLFYFPYDIAPVVRRALRHIRPALFLQVETDIWPGFLAALRRRRVPCFLLNGRLSPRSFLLYRSLITLFRPAFNGFHWVYPQSGSEGKRFLTLGLEPRRIRHCGNLKFDAREPAAENVERLRDLLRLPAGAPVLLAGSTHAGEDAVLRAVFLEIKKNRPDLLLILAPRHSERAAEVHGLFRDDPLEVALFSEPRRAESSVIIVDRLGHLGPLYALADIAFVGGSLVAAGGHNPIEPAVCGKPTLFGPDMSNFPDVSRWLLDAGGAIQVRDGAELTERCREILASPERARDLGENARRVVEEHAGTTQKVVEDILEFVGAAERRESIRA